jgi:hypothetical protein
VCVCVCVGQQSCGCFSCGLLGAAGRPCVPSFYERAAASCVMGMDEYAFQTTKARMSCRNARRSGRGRALLDAACCCRTMRKGEALDETGPGASMGEMPSPYPTLLRAAPLEQHTAALVPPDRRCTMSINLRQGSGVY